MVRGRKSKLGGIGANPTIRVNPLSEGNIKKRWLLHRQTDRLVVRCTFMTKDQRSKVRSATPDAARSDRNNSAASDQVNGLNAEDGSPGNRSVLPKTWVDNCILDLARIAKGLIDETASKALDSATPPQLRAIQIQTLGSAVAVCAGMHDTDDRILFWCDMDIHACVTDLLDSNALKSKPSRSELKGGELKQYDERARTIINRNMAARVSRMMLILPEIVEKLGVIGADNRVALDGKSVGDVVHELSEVVFAIIYQVKGVSAYEHLAKALGYMGRAVSVGRLQNVIAERERRGSLYGLSMIRTGPRSPRRPAKTKRGRLKG